MHTQINMATYVFIPEGERGRAEHAAVGLVVHCIWFENITMHSLVKTKEQSILKVVSGSALIAVHSSAAVVR